MYTKKENTQEVIIGLEALHDRFKFEVKYLREYLDFSKESVEERAENLADKIYADTLENPDLETMLQEMYEQE
ncbi:hypothetical protein, partial [Vibrio parahaemolyticus]